MREGTLPANISAAIAGNAVYVACQWAVLALLTKGLPPEDVGLFALAVAISAPVFIVADLRLRHVIVVQVLTPSTVRDFILLRMFVITLILGSVASHAGRGLVVMAVVAVAKATDSLSDICYGFFENRLRLQASAIGVVINGVASIILVAASFFASGTLEAAVVAYAAGSLIALVCWNAPVMVALLLASELRSACIRPLAGLRFSALWRLAMKSLPLGLSSAVGSLHSNLPQYTIAAMLGPAHLAPFAALAYLPAAGNVVTNAVTQAVLPQLSRDFVADRRSYIRRLVACVVFGLGLGLAGTLIAVFWGSAIISAVYTPDYARHVPLLVWLSGTAAVAYGYVFLGTGAVARKRFGSQLTISLLGLATLAPLTPALVNRFGVIGAAQGLFAAAAIQAVAYVMLTISDLRGHAAIHSAASVQYHS
jgi:O-antigen/teichoic acid export membrane protein